MTPKAFAAGVVAPIGKSRKCDFTALTAEPCISNAFTLTVAVHLPPPFHVQVPAWRLCGFEMSWYVDLDGRFWKSQRTKRLSECPI